MELHRQSADQNTPPQQDITLSELESRLGFKIPDISIDELEEKLGFTLPIPEQEIPAWQPSEAEVSEGQWLPEEDTGAQWTTAPPVLSSGQSPTALPVRRPFGGQSPKTQLTDTFTIPLPPAGAEVNRQQFKVASAERDIPLKGEDAIINDRKKGLFAIFDGMGGHAAGEVASRIAKEEFERAYLDSPIQNMNEMVQRLVDTIGNVVPRLQDEEHLRPETRGMGSTAVVAKVVRDQAGQHFVAWASVGDSRLYHQESAGKIPQQINHDEGEGNIISNVLANGYYRGVAPFNSGYFPVTKTSRVMLCSDGITGDWPQEFIDDSALTYAFNMNSIEDCAERLVEASKKVDDKSLVVFELEQM
jgi:serine/threonine protein phosphatase PrpC